MRKALVIDLNNYPNGNQLDSCANDAIAVAARLERHEDDSKNFDVILRHPDCSLENLRSGIVKCFDGSTEIALFYFAGHGMVDSYGGHILATDNANARLTLRDILEIVNKSSCQNKIVILDSCFSGEMGNRDTSSDTAEIKSGVTILTACNSEQTALERKGHGVFTELLLAALDGEAADLMGNVTPGGIYAFIDKTLGAWEQRPVFKTNVTTFLPLRRVKAQIDIKTLRNLSKYFGTANSQYALDPSYEYTNKPNVEHEVIEPYANDENIRIMKELQQLERVGLVIPCETEHMYYAAMESKCCELTAVGKHYWRLAYGNMI